MCAERSEGDSEESPKRGWRGKNTDPAFVQEQVDAIEKETLEGVLIPARQLITRLGNLYGLPNAVFQKILIGQYDLAKSKNAWSWVYAVQREARLVFSESWIRDHLPHVDARKNVRVPNRKRARSDSGNTGDVRLRQDPDFPVVSVVLGLGGSEVAPSATGSGAGIATEGAMVLEVEAPVATEGAMVLEVEAPVATEGAMVLEVEAPVATVSEAEEVATGRVVASNKVDEEARGLTVRGPELVPVEEYGNSGEWWAKTEMVVIDQWRDSQPQGDSVRETGARPKETGARPREMGAQWGEPEFKRRGGTSFCPLCRARRMFKTFKNIRKHVFEEHFPQWMWLATMECSPANLQRFMRLLEFLALRLVGNPNNMGGLIGLIESQRGVPPQTNPLPAAQIASMEAVCRYTGWPLPGEFSIFPITSPAVLIHWRCLIFLCSQLSVFDQRAFLRLCAEQPSETRAVPAATLAGEVRVSQPVSVARDSQVSQHVSLAGDGQVSQQALLARDSQVVFPPLEYSTVVMASDGGSPRVNESQMEVNGVRPLVPGRQVEVGVVRQSVPERQVEIGVVRQLVHSVSMGVRAEEVEEESGRVLNLIDSHFHLDRTRKALFGSTARALAMGVEDLLEANLDQPGPVVAANILGGVVVYCDPKHYPSEIEPSSNWLTAIGVHPRKIHDFRGGAEAQFEGLMRDPGLAALGEIGLDWTEKEDQWRAQEEVLRRVLLWSTPRLPIVLHLRGTTVDEVGPYHRALRIVKEFCGTQQRFHLHCFGGDEEVVHAWADQFPNTYFGFTANVRGFQAKQVQGLRAVPTNRLLVETDSPYLTSRQEVEINTPAYLGEVASLVAERREGDLGHLAASTLINSCQLYGIDLSG